MSKGVYDVIVVGAGIEGSATAFYLSQKQVKVLLLEQFPLPHTRGSSHGTTRITRKAYPQPFYTHMMRYCMEQWHWLQTQTSQSIFRKMGYMNIGPVTEGAVKKLQESMDETNTTYELLSPEMFQNRFPTLKYRPDCGAIHDPEGGVLYASKALNLFQELFVKQGGELRDREKVEAIHPGETIEIVTAKQVYSCRSVVLCCGPWAGEMLKRLGLDLPLEAERQTVLYWPEKVPGSYAWPHMIPFSDASKKTLASYSMFGLPSDDYPGNVKIMLHGGPVIDPEHRDSADGSYVIDLMKTYVKTHFPGLHPEPSIVEPCYYTNTPDKNPILDHHPQWNNIIIGAGFSGHGFKLSPAVGRILSALALNLEPPYNLDPFKLNRFNSVSSN